MEGLFSCSTICAFYIHYISIAEEDHDVSEMDHATKEVETPSIRIPLELDEILEPF